MATVKIKPKAEVTDTKVIKQKGKVLSEEVTTTALDTDLIGVTATAISPGKHSISTPPADVPKGLWCQVGFEASYTHNLGDFKSCKVGISLLVPCRHDEVDTVFVYSEKWVETRLQKQIGDLNKEG